MLKKNQRLSRREFTHLLKRGRRAHSTHLTLISTSADTVKCGVVVSKKTARQAVMRNKLRRYVYRIFGELLPSLPNKHIAVLLKLNAGTITYTELHKEITTLLQTKK